MKLLVAIESCIEHRDRVKAQLGTWAVGFWDWAVFDSESLKPAFDVPDDYKSLPQKTQAICKVALIPGNDWDYILKIDTDTYVHIPRLLASGFEQHDYSGYVLSWLETPYCAGPAYWLSRRAMELVASADLSKFRHPSYPDAEDVTVGLILASHGITPYHDRRYALHEDVLPANDVITSHLSTMHGAFRTEMMYAAHKKAMGE